MNQKSSLREVPQSVSLALTANSSAGALAGTDFCFIFAPYGYDEPEILLS
jgi:hypothetical protein